MILKGQKAHLAVAPNTQVRSRVGYPRGIEASEVSCPLSMALCFPSTICLLLPEHSVCGGIGVQRSCGPGEASDQYPKAMYGAHSR